MSTFVHDCPHCGTRKAGFTIRAEFACMKEANIVCNAAICNVCLAPVITVVQMYAGVPPSNHPGDFLAATNMFGLIAFYPEPASMDAPENVPANVQRAFQQAAASRQGGHFDAACSMYRKAMELGLKGFSPDIEAWKIEKRIDKMAAANKITPELQAWAHELRLDGNEAVHGDEEATSEITDQMHEFCRFLLIYLYTLPAQVEAAQIRRMLG